ncbi:RHS repeat protein [Xanthomonas sacchari]|uniref:RHS repeat protein n=1 Tax=Xanthomonas sacchari TaxID=56458 RepID=UPI0035275055
MFKARLVIGMVLLCLCARVYAADDVAPYEEYEKKIKASQVVGPLKGDIFGESVSLYDRSVSFHATDVSVPGNNALPVSLGREFKVMNRRQEYVAKGFGDWEIDTPRVYGEFLAEKGWVTTSSSPAARCSMPSRPDAAMTVNGITYPGTADDVWHGYYLHVPGAGEQEMLVDNQTKTPRPTDGVSRPWITKDGWRLGCLASVSNYAGEGFLAISPSGVKYYFDYAAVITIKSYKLPMASVAAGFVYAPRTRIALMVSRIEDRFGNWVTYSYTGDKLSSIQSSDGRAIALNYNGDLISSVQTNGQTWTYGYELSTAYPTPQGAYRLKTVTQPDGSQWIYSIASGNMLPTREPPAGGGASSCASEPDPMNGAVSLQVTHPSGAVGVFAFSYERQYRNHTPIIRCAVPAGQQPPVPYVPGYFDNYVLTSKTVTGPGLAQQTWNYAADTPATKFYTSGQATDPCPTCVPSKTVKVTNPDGTATAYEFGFMYGLNDGRLLSTTALDASGNALSKTSNSYFADGDVAAQPFPAEMGQSLLGIPNPLTNVLRPLRIRTIVQDGVSYTWTANGFDAFARTLNVTRASPWHSRTDATEYYDDLGKWILGQSAKSTNSDTGLVESQTSFDGNAMPAQRWSFGKLRLSLSYNSDGTLATVKDGNANTTTLSNWKRGVPQSIRYADGTTESATVNDSGSITSTTDENGYTTSYGYDTMGRLSSIAYPVNDTVSWNATTQAFEQVGGSEYGLDAGHWRQTVATGNARKLTYFDALWRPVLTREFDAGNEAATQRFQKFAYDYDGRTTFSSYPGSSDTLSTGTWTEYDALGRTTSVSQDSELGLLTTRTEYLSGIRTLVTNPRGQQTTTGFQVFDQPDYSKPVWIMHPEGAVTEIPHDVFGKTLAIHRRNGDSSLAVTRNYVYDDYQQLCKTVEPETGATVMDYDAAGNLAWSASGQGYTSTSSCNRTDVAASAKVGRSYDARNRLATLAFPDGVGNQSFVYTADGLPAQVTTNNSNGGNAVVNAYAYNKRRLLLSESMTQLGSSALSLGYAYTANGHPAGVTYPSGLALNYAPNALGQATQANGYALGVSYYPNGAIRQFTYGNGIVHTMAQNARQLPARSSDSGVSNPLDLGYTYDANGNVGAITDYARGRQTRSMSYDGLDRLSTTQSAMFGGDNLARYSYNVLDDLTAVKVGGSRDYSYFYNANRQLLSVNNSSDNSAVIGLSYDAQGNLSNKNGVNYVFDKGNRLREVTGVETYRYDAQGRRVLASSPSLGDIVSLYGQDGVLRYQRDERVGKISEYVYLGGSLLAKVSNLPTLASPSVTVPGYSSSGSYTVQWSIVASANRYELQEQANGGSWTALYSGIATSQAVSGKAAGSYAYRARACLGSYCGAWSASAAAVVQFAPSDAPSISVPATGVVGNYTISWGTVTGAATYSLEESANGGSWNVSYSGSAQTNAYSGKAAGSYAYRVRGCNPAGCGPYSGTGTVQAVYAPGSAPSLSAPATNTTGSYTLSWSTVATTVSYNLEESSDGGSNWSGIASVGGTSAGVSGRGAGSYLYRIKACNAAGCGPYSGNASTQVIFAPSGAPSLSAPASAGVNGYTVTWSGVATASSYTLEESANGGGWTTTQNASATSQAFSGKGNGSYAYRAKACNVAGCGPYSNTQTTVVNTSPPATPSFNSGYRYLNTSPVRFELDWTASARATRYEVTGAVSYSGPNTNVTLNKTGSVNTVQVRACNDNGCSAWSAAFTPTAEGGKGK